MYNMILPSLFQLYRASCQAQQVRLRRRKMVSVLHQVDLAISSFSSLYRYQSLDLLRRQFTITSQSSDPFSIHVQMFSLVCLDIPDPAFVIDPLMKSRTLDGPRSGQQLCERLESYPCTVCWCSRTLVKLSYHFERRTCCYCQSKLYLRRPTTLDRCKLLVVSDW